MRPLALALLVGAVAIGAAGCAEDSADDATGTSTNSTVETTAQPAAAKVAAYFPTADGEHIMRVESSGTGSPLESAIQALVAGPDAPGLGPALPPGTRLLDASVDGATARVDLSSEFAAGYPSGGSAAEIAALAPVVFTATEVDGVDAVVVTVEGAVPDVPTQFDLSAPLGRGDFPAEIVGAAP